MASSNSMTKLKDLYQDLDTFCFHMVNQPLVTETRILSVCCSAEEPERLSAARRHTCIAACAAN